MFLCIYSAQADPIELPEKPVTPEITCLIVVSILLEAVCVLFLLRRFRRPRFFILWIFGMHLLTYPGFLCGVGGVLRGRDGSRGVVEE